MKFPPRTLGPPKSMWFLWDTNRTSKTAKTSSVRPLLDFLEFFLNQVCLSCDFEIWNSLPGSLDLRNQCDSFGPLIGPPKLQKPALCDRSSIFWNFSKIRYASPATLKNEILSQDSWTSEIIVIPLGHSSDLQNCKNQLCATTLSKYFLQKFHCDGLFAE